MQCQLDDVQLSIDLCGPIERRIKQQVGHSNDSVSMFESIKRGLSHTSCPAVSNIAGYARAYLASCSPKLPKIPT